LTELCIGHEHDHDPLYTLVYPDCLGISKGLGDIGVGQNSVLTETTDKTVNLEAIEVRLKIDL
jgi:hypothetical protein